jgi:hypothetical protein
MHDHGNTLVMGLIVLPGGAGMEKLMGFVGMTVGSLVGWYLGALVGFTTGVVLSMVGSGVGLWAGRWAVQRWLEY